MEMLYDVRRERRRRNTCVIFVPRIDPIKYNGRISSLWFGHRNHDHFLLGSIPNYLTRLVWLSSRFTIFNRAWIREKPGRHLNTFRSEVLRRAGGRSPKCRNAYKALGYISVKTVCTCLRRIHIIGGTYSFVLHSFPGYFITVLLNPMAQRQRILWLHSFWLEGPQIFSMVEVVATAWQRRTNIVLYSCSHLCCWYYLCKSLWKLIRVSERHQVRFPTLASLSIDSYRIDGK